MVRVWGVGTSLTIFLFRAITTCSVSQYYAIQRTMGALKVLNYDTLNNMGNTFPNLLIKSVGGLEFLLKRNYCIDKIPVKLAIFHQKALFYILFGITRNFLYKHKSLFLYMV